jgi:hypothetical protein
MRNLSINELSLIGGAAGLGDTANGAAVGGAIGGAAGISYGMSIGASGSGALGLAGLGAAAGAGLAAAGVGGFAIGTWLNENTPIQSWISNALPDPSGTNYN